MLREHVALEDSQSAFLMAQSLRASPCGCVALFVMQNVLATCRPQNTSREGSRQIISRTRLHHKATHHFEAPPK